MSEKQRLEKLHNRSMSMRFEMTKDNMEDKKSKAQTARYNYPQRNLYEQQCILSKFKDAIFKTPPEGNFKRIL